MGMHLVWLGLLMPMASVNGSLWLGWMMLHHGSAKAALFILAGDVQRHGWRRIMLVGLVPMMALVGLPWTSGGLLKHQLKTVSHDQGLIWVSGFLMVSAIATLWLMWHVWTLLRVQVRSLQPASIHTTLPWVILSLLGLIWPWQWLHEADLSLTWLNHWNLLWPALLGALLWLLFHHRRT
jgi:hypothetical protein